MYFALISAPDNLAKSIATARSGSGWRIRRG